MVVVGGRVAFEYGDIARVTKIASVRKSVLAMLYGKYVSNGTIDLTKTVTDVGLDDVQPFLPIEKHATLLNLLTARSGIYLNSGNASLTDQSPRRGAQYPGIYFQYQNWDFNAAGTAFEKLTGRDIYDALESDLAKPLGFQDWDRKRQQKVKVLPESVHPEYAMYLSTRDLARLGLLMSRRGEWRDARVLPVNWTAQITSLVTPTDQIHPIGAAGSGVATRTGRWGYGLLWWVWDAPMWPGLVSGPYQGAFTAIGANGQYVTVFPPADTVVVHKVDIDKDGSAEVSPEEYMVVLDMLIAARCPGSCARQ
jgi:CubicO group peptidase (beta-lactamase class C family)